MSIQTYQRAVAQAETPRELEFRAFANATGALQRIQEAGRGDLGALAEALDANRRLWTLLSADCAAAGNQLPAPLRAQIISLALWVSRHSSEVMRSGADIGPLIDVNRTIMDGLMAR